MSEVPKPSYRLIVARFGENLDWVDAFETYTIYNKGRDNMAPRHRVNSARLPNVGREGHSYIHHIVENYENLEDVLIFSQGDYGAHLDCSPEEFLQRALDIEDLGFSTLGRRGPTGTNARNFTLHEYHGPLRSRIPYDLGGWWEMTTGEAYVRSRGVFWNSMFSVRKEFVLKRSRDSYRRLLETLAWDRNPMEAHFCERTWFNILSLPLTFATEPDAPPPPPSPPVQVLEKDASFDTVRLLERWESEKPKRAVNKITVRFSPKPEETPESPIITREEMLGLLDHVGDLMEKDTETVRMCTEALRHNIEGWARQNCPRYPLDRPFVTKDDLADKSGWYVDSTAFESAEVGTTGSTTGYSFRYMRWHPAFNKIEWDYHYDLVLDEFGVRDDAHVLYFFSEHYKTSGSDPVACFGVPSELNMNNHGSKRRPVVHYANFALYQRDPEGFFRALFEYMGDNRIDVLFTSPPQVSSMCNYIRKFRFKGRLAGLLSSTGDKISPADAYFLFVQHGYFDDVCDHMRCWDGGATFYTCRHRNYHLMDNLCWVEEIDGKMVCTDYFNLASPFVRYWNGDYCRIGKEYRRCECGKLYREFEFVESRPFSLKGVCMRQIKEGMRELNIPGIKEVRCSVDHLDVVSSRPISREDRLRIASLTDKFAFRFVLEEHHS